MQVTIGRTNEIISMSEQSGIERAIGRHNKRQTFFFCTIEYQNKIVKNFNKIKTECQCLGYYMYVLGYKITTRNKTTHEFATSCLCNYVKAEYPGTFRTINTKQKNCSFMHAIIHSHTHDEQLK